MNAIVTGTSRGIGKEIVKKLLSEGINVIAVSRHMYMVKEFAGEDTPKEGHGKVIPLSVDITNTSVLKDKLLQIVEEEFNGVVDMVINNAGLLKNKPFDEFTGNEVNDIMQVNFVAPALLTGMLIDSLQAAKKAHVVNISSMGGYPGSVKFPGLSYYSASKSALASLTENLAEEYKSGKISFNCLALGAVDTEMLQQAFPGMKAPLSAEEMAAYIVDFAKNGHKYFNGKVLPVTSTTP